MQPSEMLQRILHTVKPETLVCCGDLACALADEWTVEHPAVVLTKLAADDPNRAFPLPELNDLALVSDTLEHLPEQEGKILLGQLRNFGAQRIAVLMTRSECWRFQDFIALGFKRHAHSDNEPRQTLYTYDIASYNHKRQWNNPDNWANPEMWDKARW